jgi:hypothetical protein
MKKFVLFFMLSTLSSLSFSQDSKTLMLKLELTDNYYFLADSWLLAREFPATVSADALGEGSLSWTITSTDGKVLAEGIVPDPQVLRGHFSGTGNDANMSIQNSRVTNTTLIIRTPYDERMNQLNIERMPIISLPNNPTISAAKFKKADMSTHSFRLTPRAPE